MTTEKNLTEEFFRVFGIFKKCSDKRYEKCMGICYDCKYFKHSEITDHKLLEMICLINKNTKNYNKSTYFKQDYKNLKDEILEETLFCYKTNCLLNKEKEQFKYHIQQLFKEENK